MDISEDAPESPIARFREAIAIRNEEYAQAFPAALNLEAQVLHDLHQEINGEAVNLRGVRSAQGFRAALLGEKNFTLADLCRLATSPTREARSAVKAALQELAASIGMELVAIDAKATEAHEAAANFVLAAGQLGSGMTLALANDGKLDQHEARALEPALDLAQKSLDRARATVRTAKGGA